MKIEHTGVTLSPLFKLFLKTIDRVTPICTTEMIAFSQSNTYFTQINTNLIGLSVDSNPSHLAWVYDIYTRTGIAIPFPIIADRNGEIARKYGMISSNISNTSTVRNVFVIDDKQVIRTILIYPMNIGRNIPEILRIVRALQTADSNNLSAPANWVPYDPMAVPPPTTYAGVTKQLQHNEHSDSGFSWYLSFKKPEQIYNFTPVNANTSRQNYNNSPINNGNANSNQVYNNELLNRNASKNMNNSVSENSIANKNSAININSSNQNFSNTFSNTNTVNQNHNNPYINQKTPNRRFPPKEIR